MIGKMFLSCIILLYTQEVFGQIGIGTSSPDGSSVLDVSSTDKGVLLPRMTITQRDAILNPAEGLTIYNVDENCLQINSGSVSSPDWSCVGSSTASVMSDCDGNGFEDVYVDGVALTSSHKFSVTINNNSFNSATISFTTDDLVLSGVSGVSVNSVSPTSATIASGDSQVIEYTLTGTPGSTGALTGVWTKLGLTCTRVVQVEPPGDATFSLPLTAFVASLNNGTEDIQGIVDNGSNQLTVSIPYTGGSGIYSAYAGTFTLNNSGTGEGGDVNSFRLTYPGGTFASSGIITATIEVNGDGSFDAEKQVSFGTQETIAALDVQVNGISKGNVNLDIIGGIPDRNYSDINHRFIYSTITVNGQTWLSNNLGANYTNTNHTQFNPLQQATSATDFHAYGSIYQWGRYSDGHELVTHLSSTTGTVVNGTTTATVGTNTPDNSLYIINGSTPFDWRIPQNDGLWQGESGVNNPCPHGYRLPVESEMNAYISFEGISVLSVNNGTLALTYSGTRSNNPGAFVGSGVFSGYWTSSLSGDFTPTTISSRARVFTVGTSVAENRNRAVGLSVRCIKN